MTSEIIRAAALGLDTAPFDVSRIFDDARDAIVTDEHPAASYGLPVVVYQGVAYGPADLPGVELVLKNDELIERARAAGWKTGPTTEEMAETEHRHAIERGHHEPRGCARCEANAQ